MKGLSQEQADKEYLIMMIIKLDDGTYNIFDTLGGMGIWNMDREGLSKYLNLIKQERRFSKDDVRSYPLLESLYSTTKHYQPSIKEDEGPFIKEIIQQGLPMKCYFDTDIVLKNADKYQHGIINPPSISLDVNKVCNFSCKWCCVDIKSGDPHGDMSADHIPEKIIKPMVAMGNLTWYLTGGEPGLTPVKTAEIAGSITRYTAMYSSEKPFIALDTNGTNFVENARLFKESGINTIQFSLSSSSPDVDRYFRGIPPLINSVELVKNAVNTAKALGMHCGINMVVWKESKGRHNFEEIEGIIDFAFALKADFIRVTPAVTVGAAAKNGMDMNIHDLKYIEQTISNKRHFMGENVSTRIISIVPLHEEKLTSLYDEAPLTCRAGTCFIHIDHCGYVYPCALVMPDFCVGNVNKDNIIDLWRSSNVMIEWRTVTDISEECACCAYRNCCFGRCPAYAWFKFRSIDLRERPLDCQLLKACC